MRLSSTIILSALMAAAFAAPALADEMQMKPGQMMMMGPDGKMMTMQMDDKMAKEAMGMMDKAQAMKGPMMMMMGSDGKMHMSDDMKMSDGKMMSDPMMMKK